MNRIALLLGIIVVLGAIPNWADSATTAVISADTALAATDSSKAAGIVTEQQAISKEAAADTIYPITPQRRELLNKYSATQTRYASIRPQRISVLAQ